MSQIRNKKQFDVSMVRHRTDDQDQNSSGLWRLDQSTVSRGDRVQVFSCSALTHLYLLLITPDWLLSDST